MNNHRPNSVHFLIIEMLALGAVFLAAWNIRHPGLYYDELIFTNASFLGADDYFIGCRLFGIPVLIMDYIGALKSWLYWPIFTIVPVNELTVRLPAILLGVAGGTMVAVALGRMFGRSAAIFGTLLILFDPSLLTHSRLDWGPTALMFFFRGLLMLSLANWILDSAPKWAWLALLSIILGVFDKLNFLWLAAAAVGALVVAYPRRLRRFAMEHPRHSCLLFLLFGLFFVSAFWRALNLSPNYGAPIKWDQRTGHVFDLLKLLLVGGGPLNFVSGNGMRLGVWVWPALFLCGMAAIPGIGFLMRHPQRRFLLFIFLWFTGTFLAFFATPGATGYHHAAVLASFPQAMLAVPLALIYDAQGPSWAGFRRIALACTILAFVCLIIANVVCLHAFTLPTNPNWDQANAEAARFALAHPERRYVTTDWGMGAQLFALSKSRLSVGDNWPSFVDEKAAVKFVSAISQNEDVDLLVRTEGSETFPATRRNLYAALDALSITVIPVAEFTNAHGKVSIQVMRMKTPTPETLSSGR
jgi:hypothetical protein